MPLRPQQTIPTALLVLVLVGGAASASPISTTLEAMEAQIEETPRDSALWSDYGNLLVMAGRLDEARAAYETAIDLDATSVLAHYNLGLLLLETGQPRNAATHFRKAVDIDPGFARAHYALGSALAARQRHRRAVLRFSRAFELDPALLEAHHNPEILFNELATWASMHHYLKHSAGRRTRVYDDPAPILGLLVPELEAIETDSDAAEAEAEEKR